MLACRAAVAALIGAAVAGGALDSATRIGVLYDPGLHLFADTVEIERMWDVSRVLPRR